MCEKENPAYRLRIGVDDRLGVGAPHRECGTPPCDGEDNVAWRPLVRRPPYQELRTYEARP